MTPEEFLKQKVESHPLMFDSFGRQHHYTQVYIDDAHKAVELARKEAAEKVLGLLSKLGLEQHSEEFRKLICNE